MPPTRTLGLLIAGALPAAAATGVAFVHGTGNQSDALNDYWTAEMVNSVRQGLPDQSNYVVINCNFEQYMWTSGAAGCSFGKDAAMAKSDSPSKRDEDDQSWRLEPQAPRKSHP